MANILIVEDNPDIRLNIIDFLQGCGYRTDNTDDGLRALGLLAINRYDLIVLDWMLPGVDGISVCKELRRRGNQTPVLMLSAKDALSDRIEGLTEGADDYLVKPFSLAELRLRIEAILRRTGGKKEEILTVSDLVLNLREMKVERAGCPVKLNPSAFKILRLLMEKSPGVVTRSELEELLWGSRPPDSDSLRTHLHSLRSAVDKPFKTSLIKTVTGFGWSIGSE